MINPYQILDVKKDSSDEEISRAYKQLAKKYHPDRCKDANASDKMAAITEAYNLIKTKELRVKYEEENAFTSDFSLFSSLFGKSHVAENFKKPPVDRKLQKNGRNIRKTIYIPNSELHKPNKLTLQYKRKSSCLTCSGTGAEKFRKCTKCGGTGKFRTVVRNGNTLKDVMITCDTCKGSRIETMLKCQACDGVGITVKNVTISFMYDGKHAEYRFTGRGNSGIHNGTNGDLLVKVKGRK